MNSVIFGKDSVFLHELSGKMKIYVFLMRNSSWNNPMSPCFVELINCGCHMVLFTTGRGTPFGTYVPTMKISTNSTLAKNKPGWIDFNAGVILENEPMEKTCERFVDYIIRVASGEFVNNEKKGYKEIAIFKTGVTL